MEKMLDAGFCLPATCPLVPVYLAMLGKRSGLAWQAGRLRLQARRAGRQYPVSETLWNTGINVRFQNFVFFWFRLVRAMK